MRPLRVDPSVLALVKRRVAQAAQSRCRQVLRWRAVVALWLLASAPARVAKVDML